MKSERGEQNPGKEVIASREAIKRGVAELLASRYGVDMRKVLAKEHSIQVTLRYDESGAEVPQNLQDFVKSCYGGRAMGIEGIEVGFGYTTGYEGLTKVRQSENGYINVTVSHLYPHTPEEIAQAKERVVISGAEEGIPITESVARLEQKAGLKYVVLPDRNLVLSNNIVLLPFDPDMNYGITAYELQDWLQKDHPETPGERVKRLISPIGQIVDPHRIGMIDEQPEKNIPYQIVKGNLNPSIIMSIASQIPDLPPNTSFRVVNHPFAGKIKHYIPQPVKRVELI